jgi:hypothetical protein
MCETWFIDHLDKIYSDKEAVESMSMITVDNEQLY